MSNQDSRDDLDSLLDAWVAGRPPEGFADRVLAARGDAAANPGTPAPVASPPRRRNPRALVWAAGIVGGLSAAALAFALWTAEPAAPVSQGSMVADLRSTVELGPRGVAVTEPGASIEWTVSSAGQARVQQTRGTVFYRVNPSPAPFQVDTPAGRVEVRGTSFSVEVDPVSVSKQAIISGALGAIASAAVVVTVYEGRVDVQNASGAVSGGPGDRLVAAAGVSPTAVGDTEADDPRSPIAQALVEPPGDDATRADLLVRDQAQRDEIQRLRRKVEDMRGELAAAPQRRRGGPGGGRERPGSMVNPTQEELLEWAKDCRVRMDMPPALFMGDVDFGSAAGDLGLTDDQIAKGEAAATEYQQRIRAEVRLIYIAATGDTGGGDTLSVNAMRDEIMHKSAPDEMERVRRAISAERAGLATPPATTDGMSPAERMLRLMARSGSEFEDVLGAAIGPDKARQLREANDGWGMQMDMGGCAENGGGDEDEVVGQ